MTSARTGAGTRSSSRNRRQALYKGIEGKDWEEMYDSNKMMSKTVGVKKPQEAPSLVGHERSQRQKGRV